MSNIIDRRKSGKNKSVGNRQKFIKRYKHKIKESVDNIASEKGITDVLKDRKIVINDNDIDEPSFDFDLSTGERDIILPGNKTHQKGDKIRQPPESDDEGTSGSPEGEGFDEFSFTLTKEEFLDLYFSDMCLPDFIKESLKGSVKQIWKRTGYSKDGIPPRLDLVKTLKQGLARRIATKNKCDCVYALEQNYSIKKRVKIQGFECEKCENTGVKKQRYLDDIDLHYKHFTKQPFPIRKAVMILLMDVSYSMGEYEKSLAKKFFLLLYLFLHKVYKTVDVVFIAHTQVAKVVTEQEFFYGTETGGTVVSSGLEAVRAEISKIDLETTNIYVSQASDGDNWPGDDTRAEELLLDILKEVQYFAYVQTEQRERRDYKDNVGSDDLLDLYERVAESHRNLQCRYVEDATDVYPVLRSLFEAK